MKLNLKIALLAVVLLLSGCSLLPTGKSTKVAESIVSASSTQRGWWEWLQAGELSCSHGIKIHVNAVNDHALRINYSKKNYILHRQLTTTGAYRYEEASSGLVFLLLPEKVSLLNKKTSKRLADQCMMSRI